MIKCAINITPAPDDSGRYLTAVKTTNRTPQWGVYWTTGDTDAEVGRLLREFVRTVDIHTEVKVER